MRYTRGVRYKERQRGHLYVLKTDTIFSTRYIPVEWNRMGGGAWGFRDERPRLQTIGRNRRTLGSGREEGSTPIRSLLVGYGEWRVIDGCLYREEERVFI